MLRLQIRDARHVVAGEGSLVTGATAALRESMATAAAQESLATATAQESMATVAAQESMATAAAQESMATLATVIPQECMATVETEAWQESLATGARSRRRNVAGTVAGMMLLHYVRVFARPVSRRMRLLLEV